MWKFTNDNVTIECDQQKSTFVYEEHLAEI